jgi:hypothetical protein
MSYPFDPRIRELVADRLYRLLPELYRLRDFPDAKNEPKKALQTEPGLEELYRFVHVLAAPLAEVRQSIEEMHGNLFVDTAADWALPFLAQLVDLPLIFPEARSNRRDLRSAVAFRRRKGTRATLEQLGNELSERLVVTQEGFKRLLVSQDLDFLREAHGMPRLTAPLVGEIATGSHDRLAHVVDVRPPTEVSGRYHPRQITHWLHATTLFPLREGEPFAFPAAADRRFAFAPLGAMVGLRVRKETPTERLLGDVVLAEHFRAEPARYFDQTGLSASRLCVRVNGLPAAVAGAEMADRLASRVPAHEELVRTRASVSLLEFSRAHRSDDVEVALVAAPLPGLLPSLANLEVRCSMTIRSNGNPVTPLSPGSNVAMAAPFIALLRLRRPGGGGGAFFSGGTFLFTSEALEARRTSAASELAREGYLRGALLVTIPPTWLHDTGAATSGRWFYVAADGSLFDAQSTTAAQSGAAPDVPLQNATQLANEPLVTGPLPAWPPLPPSHSQVPLPAAPPSPWRGPVFMHGGPVLRRVGGAIAALGAPTQMALTFALFSQNTFTPFVRIVWDAADPTTAAAFQLVGPTGVAASETSAAAALGVFMNPQSTDPAVWQLLQDVHDVDVVVRFEAASSGLLLPPAEVALTSALGRTTLVHLPELETASPTHTWAHSLAFASRIVRIQEDGSTAHFGTYDLARRAYGAIAPLREPAALVRREVAQRVLCGWSKETNLPPFVPPTPQGRLDIDPEHGLFALANADALVPYPKLVGQSGAPPVVTIDAQEGYSQHVGTRPAVRQPLLGKELSTPTRVVLQFGRFHRGAPGTLGRLPRHDTLAGALAAIAALPPHDEEVIQIEDSATYSGETLAWPTNVKRLTIQAAEGERPIVQLQSDVAAGAAVYARFHVCGIGFSGGDIAFPASDAIDLDFVSILESQRVVRFIAAAAHDTEVAVRFSLLGRLEVTGNLQVRIADSVIDATGGRAIAATKAHFALERVTVVARESDLPLLGAGGPPLAVDVRTLSASEVLFAQAVRALDRFSGCIRYSRVEPGSETPRRHRVVEDEPKFVSLDRNDPAHLRLSERCPRSILTGAEDGSEMGAFHRTRLVQVTNAVRERIVQFTPAGMRTGIIRVD